MAAKADGVLAMVSIAGGIACGQASSSGPNKVLKTAKVGGDGGFDYVFADVNARRLYIPRRAPAGLTVFDLDTLAPVGAIPEIAAGMR